MKTICLLFLLIIIGCSRNEVQQLPSGDLISCFKPAKQSTNFNWYNSYPASKAFDCRNQPLHGANFSQTGLEQYPWIEVDLGTNYQIDQIDVINRQDNAIFKGRLKKFKIFITSSPLTTGPATELPTTGQVASYDRGTAPALDSLSFQISRYGRYVRLWMDNTVAPNYLSISEIRVWGKLSQIVCRDTIYKVPVIVTKDSVVTICDTISN